MSISFGAARNLSALGKNMEIFIECQRFFCYNFRRTGCLLKRISRKSVAEDSHYWRNSSHYVRSFINFVCTQLKNAVAKKQLNRIKVVLAEKNKTGIWLAQQLGKDRTTVSKWCSNAVQPSLETVIEIAQCLGVGVEELIRMPEKDGGGE